MDMKSLFHAELPYPPVCVERPDIRYARAMLDNLGGGGSEMSAVGRYFYNHLVTCDRPDISKAFHGIAIVEMHHLDTFGQLALLLGEDPRLWAQKGQRKVYWSPCACGYTIDFKSMIHQALQAEHATIKKYTCQKHTIRDCYIVSILERIILDEQLHITLLTKLLESCS